MELKVGGDEILRRRVRFDRFEYSLKFRHVRRWHPERREGGGGGLEDAAHLKELKDGVVTMEVDDEAQCLKQQRRREARRVGAVALPHVEHVDQAERAHRLPERTPGQAKFGGQVGFPRQLLTRPHPAGSDHLLDLLDRLVGKRHARPPGPNSLSMTSATGSTAAFPAPAAASVTVIAATRRAAWPRRLPPSSRAACRAVPPSGPATPRSPGSPLEPRASRGNPRSR
jgi:hypothetical protein